MDLTRDEGDGWKLVRRGILIVAVAGAGLGIARSLDPRPPINAAGLTSTIPFRSAADGTVTLPPPRVTTSTTVDPCRRPADGTRPENGTEFVPPGSGRGVLEVANGTSMDAEVKLFAADREVVVDVYVRAGQRASVAGVPVGTYSAAYAQGRLWDPAVTRFTCDRRAKQFDEELDFPERTIMHWTISLQPVPGGTATTSTMDANAFDAL